MTEVFIDSTFGTNKHGCYDLVSPPLSYLLLDTRGVQEEGKREFRLTAWLRSTALRAMANCTISSIMETAVTVKWIRLYFTLQLSTGLE
ncbi:uncharacterized protein V1513DRAFT_451857 [Lipomyces chichibuensis]|uniref:uncharacterized protein n=1 Tax=Lipomyces chichibuensis TaxID=1546026 RepID=UPI00334326E8